MIGHFGRFVKQKNHDFLIDVFNEYHTKNPDSKLLLVGTGPLEEKIKDKVEKLNLSDSVLFLGQREDTNKLYSAMDVFCLPSLYEGLPVVGVEAQAAGLLCIFSDKITPDVIISNQNSIIRSLNIIEWKNYILQKFKNGQIREFVLLEKNYSIKNNITYIEKYYNDK